MSQLALLEGYTDKGQKLFKKRASSIVHGLNARMKKRGFSGRLPLDVGRKTLAEGVGKPCPYCGVIIKIQTMSADHPMPVARGGSPFGIECICKSCNEIKGELSKEEYVRLRSFMDQQLAPEGKSDLLGRLHAGAFGIRMIAQAAGRNFKDRKKAEAPVREAAEPWPFS